MGCSRPTFDGGGGAGIDFERHRVPQVCVRLVEQQYGVGNPAPPQRVAEQCGVTVHAVAEPVFESRRECPGQMFTGPCRSAAASMFHPGGHLCHSGFAMTDAQVHAVGRIEIHRSFENSIHRGLR